MTSHKPPAMTRQRITPKSMVLWMAVGLFITGGTSFSPVCARTTNTPWTNEVGVQNLVLGASSMTDVIRIMGNGPDEIVRSQQMFPVIENYYYFDENKSGAATVFVFENGMLAGLQLKTAGNQYVDLTYVLPNNGDRILNRAMLGGFAPYFQQFPIPSW